MAASTRCLSIITKFVVFLLVASTFSSVFSVRINSTTSGNATSSDRNFRPDRELQKLRRIRAYLKKINKPAIKTIQSPDGDVIDCVPSHLQPAFDHPELKGQKPLEPPIERPRGGHDFDEAEEAYTFQ